MADKDIIDRTIQGAWISFCADRKEKFHQGNHHINPPDFEDFKAGWDAAISALKAGEWVEIDKIGDYFDFSAMEEFECYERVALHDGIQWEHGTLTVKCAYDCGEEPMVPAAHINHSYAETVYLSDYKWFMRLPQLPGEG